MEGRISAMLAGAGVSDGVEETGDFTKVVVALVLLEMS